MMHASMYSVHVRIECLTVDEKRRPSTQKYLGKHKTHLELCNLYKG